MKRQMKDWIPGRMSTRIDQGPCPSCKVHLEWATDVKEGVYGEPKPGSFCVCVGCSALNILDDQMKLRKPTSAELALASIDPEASRIIANATRKHMQWKVRA